MSRAFFFLSLAFIALLTTILYHVVNKNQVDYRRAESCFAQKKFEKAIPLYEKLVKTGFKKEKVLKNLGLSYIETGQNRQALEILTQLFDDDSSNAEIALIVAGLHMEFKEFDKSISVCRIILKKHPDNLEARLYIARSLVALNRHVEAVSEYLSLLEKLKGHNVKIGNADEEQVRKELKDSLAWIEFKKEKGIAEKAELYFKQKKYADALKIYRALLEKDPGRLDIALKVSVIYMEIHDFRKAASCSRDILKKHPDCLEARLNLARMLVALGKHKEAVQEYMLLTGMLKGQNVKVCGLSEQELTREMDKVRSWIEKKPPVKVAQAKGQQRHDKGKPGAGPAALTNEQTLLFRKTEKHTGKKEFAEAADLYRKHLKTHPDDMRVRFKLAQVLSWAGKKKEAAEILESTLAPKERAPASGVVNPYESISDYKTRFELARILSYDAATRERALEQYKILLGQKPGDRQLRLEYAKTLGWAGNYTDAEKELKSLLALVPDDREACAELGTVYLYVKDYPGAEQIFEKLHSEMPGKPEYTLSLARSLNYGGKRDKALQIYKEYLAQSGAVAADIFTELGDLYLGMGKLKEAADAFGKALDLTPDSTETAKKYGLALSWSGEKDRALPVLLKIISASPRDREAGLELARIYYGKKKAQEGLSILEPLITEHPEDIELKIEAAGLEASLGHARKSRNHYNEALKYAEDSHKTDLSFAGMMNMWGDFYRIEKIYRDHLKSHPADTDVLLKRAWVLASSQRYEEAEGVFRTLLVEQSGFMTAIIGIAEIKLLEKNFPAAIEYAEKASGDPGFFPESQMIIGEARFLSGNYDSAIDAYQKLLDLPDFRLKALIGMGKAYLKIKDPKRAQELFQMAGSSFPDSIEARFWNTGKDTLSSDRYLKDLFDGREISAPELSEWGGLFASQGLKKNAIECYRKAIEKDPEYFPARISLAEALAANNQYDEAITLLGELYKEFPENSKILTLKARVLGWSKHYEESMGLYEELSALDPKDPLPRKEKARVATWAKLMDRAADHYDELLTPPVDKKLLDALSGLSPAGKSVELDAAVDRLRKEIGKKSVWQGFEEFKNTVEKPDSGIPPEMKSRLQLLLADLLPDYRIQKAAWLEKNAKRFTWNRHFISSKKTYEDLTGFTPGNEEAIFDYAQSLSTLRLYDESAEVYNKLLLIDPLHSLAQISLKRLKILSHPYLEADYSYWNEEGRGDLSRITRERTDLVADVPVGGGRGNLRIKRDWWTERPDFTGISYGAEGYTAEFDGMLSENVEAAGSYTRKNYYNNTFAARETGYIHGFFNLNDYTRLGVGYDRTDELYNFFCLEQGTQANNIWALLSLKPHRKWDIDASYRSITYSDNNSGYHSLLSLGYEFTDHPRIFKATLTGEARNTLNKSIYIYDGSQLFDIIHPYWTPQNYTAGSLTFEWRHDISKFYLSDSERHYYDIRLGGGIDSENNPQVKLEGEWHYEFSDHWTASLKGTLCRSPQWNAEGLWANLRYQF
ncbi:MAG: tetratricopeptide repeat protein [Vulcanimicrobiota bacterium]